MTVVSAWVRRTQLGAEELVIASDSRLSGYGSLDCSPKIIQLPRSDSLIAYSGDTFFAYPVIHQITEAIRGNRSIHERIKDYGAFRNYVLKIMNEMYSFFHGAPKELKNPDTGFILAGYSWFKKEFMIDVISFRKGSKRFEHRPVGDFFGRGKVCFTGDMGKEGFRRLRQVLLEKYGSPRADESGDVMGYLNMEPFEVIRDMLREANENTASIGGAPQVVTVAQHMNSRQTAIYWPSRESGKIFLGGAPVVDLNYLDNWIMDPDTLEKSHLHYRSHGQRE